VVGHAITASKDIEHAANEFLEQLNREEIDQFRVMTDFKVKFFKSNFFIACRQPCNFKCSMNGKNVG